MGGKCALFRACFINPDLVPEFMDVYRLIKPASVAFIFLGALVMLGWIADIPLLKAPLPNAPTMKFTTALSVLLGGVLLRAFYHITHSEKQPASMIKIMVGGCLLFMMAFPLAVGYFWDVDTGFQLLTFASETQNPIPSLGTIVSISILFFLAFLAAMGYSISKTSKWGGLALLGMGGMALVGYVFQIPSMYYLTTQSTGMAIHTAAAFTLQGLFFFMLGIQPHHEGTPVAVQEAADARRV